MNIIVCIKQVPDPREFSKITIDPVRKTIVREGIQAVINPLDRHALEEALRIREKYGGKVTVVSMGPPQALEACKEALAFGADEAVLLCDKLLAGSDTLATAYALSKAIRRLKPYNLILCGNETVDGSTGQVPPQLAEFLELPHVTRVRRIELVDDGKAIVESVLEHGCRVVEVKLPAVLAVVKEINTPRILSVFGIVAAASKKIIQWSVSDIEADIGMIGLEGSPTRVTDVFTPEIKRRCEIFKGPVEDAVKQAVRRLREIGAF
jgi:electron transfer flavoprotein beta subunit